LIVLQDKDLVSIQQARRLVLAADQALKTLKTFNQQQVDSIVAAMAEAARLNARRLAELAVEETGRGKVEDKTTKNLFSAVDIFNSMQGMKTCDVIREDPARGLIEIAVPYGVIAAVVPTTNPTSTAIFKVLAAVKGRNTVVVAPHPQAVRCTLETVRLMYEAALGAGAPENCVGCMDEVSLEGTNELMRHKKTSLILATGGIGMVRAAYSSGKPAYGVGPGNVPSFIERTADVAKAVGDVIAGKTFDNGLLCSSEQSLIVDRPIRDQAIEELRRNRAHLLSGEEQAALERVIQKPGGGLNPDVVGKSPQLIGAMAGFQVPSEVVCLVGFPKGVGKVHPLSMEKLSPILAFYEVDGWEAGCELCIEILSYGGLGHTMSIHSQNRDVVLQFGLKKPAYRICVNTSSTHGSVGLTTGLDPSMTLGCGSPGGNITSDNITARHLINIRRVAYETRPVSAIRFDSRPSATRAAAGGGFQTEQVKKVVQEVVENYLLQKKRAPPTIPEVPSRGASQGASTGVPEPVPGLGLVTPPPSRKSPAVDFVCEEDVKRALDRGEKIVVNARTILTPSARDAGQGKSVFIWE
jgi:acetaldehyde dehydrogenase (acetylating)